MAVEQQRPHSERRFQAMIEHVADAIIMIDAKGTLLYVSPADQVITGYSAAERLGTSGFALVHPDDLEQTRAMLEQYISQPGASTPFTLRFRHKDGSIRWIEGTGVNLLDDPAVQGIMINYRDATYRRQTEEALRLSEDRYCLLAKHLPNSVVILFDHDFRFVLVDGPEVERTGYSKTAMEGKTLHEVLPPDFARTVEPNMRAVLAGQQFTAELPFEDQLYVYNYVPLRNEQGAVVYGLILGQNITARHRAEHSLRQSEEQLRSIISNLPLVFFVIDADGVFTVSEGKGLEALGLQPGEVVGQSVFALYQEWPPIVETLHRALAGEILQAIHDMDEIIFEVFYTPLRDEHGQPAGVMGVGADVTERHRAAKEREQLITDLEAQNTELERFTYTVSHDLKSPLVTIGGFLGLLQQDAAEGNAERIERDIAQISSAADKMGRLLSELLELSRIGRLMNPPEEIGLSDLASEAASLVEGQIKERGVLVEIAPEMPVVYGDRVRLLEVYQNLIDNAAKFMGDQAHPRIEISVWKRDDKPVYYVKDNGLGIEPRYNQKVFGLFERLDPHGQSTGIGLSIVKRIIEVHGGRIWVESEGLGRGSAFCFTLPDNKDIYHV